MHRFDNRTDSHYYQTVTSTDDVDVIFASYN